ncbi:MAG: hypothetical protein ABEJ48_00480 [Halobacteriales archaeon]
MFTERELPPALASIRDDHAPGARCFDCERDFDTVDPPFLDDLATMADSLEPLSYPTEWVPPSAPEILPRIAGSDLVIGYPEHGSVTWTCQTDPPTVLIKPRARSSPSAFVDFLIAEAFVEIGTDLPEHFLGFFEDHYRTLGTTLDPGDRYQLAAALYDAYVGLYTRDVFDSWVDRYPALHDAYVDAGERLTPRVSDVIGEVGRGTTTFPDAAELACAGVKHDLDLPAPFDALDTAIYREHGGEYASRWTEKVLAATAEVSDDDLDDEPSVSEPDR